jgi:hypothetical protein
MGISCRKRIGRGWRMYSHGCGRVPGHGPDNPLPLTSAGGPSRSKVTESGPSPLQLQEPGKPKSSYRRANRSGSSSEPRLGHSSRGLVMAEALAGRSPGFPGPPKRPACGSGSGRPWTWSSSRDLRLRQKGSALAMVEPLSEDLEAWQGVFPAGVLAALHPALETLDQPEDLRSGLAPRERQEFWVFSEADSISEFLERVELRRGEVVLKARRISSVAVTWD